LGAVFVSAAIDLPLKQASGSVVIPSKRVMRHPKGITTSN